MALRVRTWAYEREDDHLIYRSLSKINYGVLIDLLHSDPPRRRRHELRASPVARSKRINYKKRKEVIIEFRGSVKYVDGKT